MRATKKKKRKRRDYLFKCASQIVRYLCPLHGNKEKFYFQRNEMAQLSGTLYAQLLIIWFGKFQVCFAKTKKKKTKSQYRRLRSIISYRFQDIQFYTDFGHRNRKENSDFLIVILVSLGLNWVTFFKFYV